MQGTTAKKGPIKWPANTLKKISSNTSKIHNIRLYCKSTNMCTFSRLRLCKIFTVVKVQAVVIRTMTSYNKRCSVLNKQPRNTCKHTPDYQVSQPRRTQQEYISPFFRNISLWFCESLVLMLVQTQGYFCKAYLAISGILHSTNLFSFCRQPSPTADSNHARFSFRAYFGEGSNLVLYIQSIFICVNK